jgi:hypothetical protein
MKLRLKLHPDSPGSGASSIVVEVQRSHARTLMLSYGVDVALGALRLPARAQAARTDGLWRRTCLEAFVRPPAGEAYYELNFSPSTQWAAYRLDGYRRGISPAQIPSPQIEVRSGDDGLELAAALDLGPLADLPAGAPWRLGLSAVIEAADGRMSYWALAHPPGQPDFHHPDCFAGELVAPEAP